MKNLALLHKKIIDLWRAGYNPLRSLTMARVVSLLEAGERGEYANLQWFYRFIEKRDATLRALKRRRLSSLKKLTWNIKTTPEKDLPPGATKTMADDQAQTLRNAYDAINNLTEAIGHIALAEFRGFSHCEKHFTTDRDIFHLEPVPQWYFLRKLPYGPWRYDSKATNDIRNAVEIHPDNFVIREIDDPIDEIAAISFIRKGLSQKDWDGFIEVFGIPAIFVIGPPGVDSDKESEYQDIAEDIIADARGYLPNGSQVETIGGDVRGTAPFKDHIDYQDSQVVLAGTSGKLTMLNDPTGLGSGQSEVHQDTFDELAQAEAKEISELFQQQIDAYVLSKHHDGQPALAYFELAAEDADDVNALVENAVKLDGAGIEMDVDELAERTGYKLARNSAPQPSDSTGRAKPPAEPPPDQTPKPDPISNRSTGDTHVDPSIPADPLLQSSLQAAASALASDMQPVRDRIEHIIAIEDPEYFNAAIRNLKQDLPTLLAETNADPSFARTLENALSSATLNGVLASTGRANPLGEPRKELVNA